MAFLVRGLGAVCMVPQLYISALGERVPELRNPWVPAPFYSVTLSPSHSFCGMGYLSFLKKKKRVSLPISEGCYENYKEISTGNCFINSKARCQQKLVFIHLETEIFYFITVDVSLGAINRFTPFPQDYFLNAHFCWNTFEKGFLSKF